MIYLHQHTSKDYGPRTKHNADQGVTLAFAVDHTTAGERLTQRHAAGRIVKVSPTSLASSRANIIDKIVQMMEKTGSTVLNIAGNGIYTWEANGFDQQYVNDSVYDMVYRVSFATDLTKIVSGGQSGTDIAGAIAGHRLGIDTHVTWPKGYKMRFADGVDRYHTREQIFEILRNKGEPCD